MYVRSSLGFVSNLEKYGSPLTETLSGPFSRVSGSGLGRQGDILGVTNICSAPSLEDTIIQATDADSIQRGTLPIFELRTPGRLILSSSISNERLGHKY